MHGMRYGRSPLLTWPCLISLVVFVAVLSWWARGQFGDEFRARIVGHHVLLFGSDGSLAVLAERGNFDVDKGEYGAYSGPSGLLESLRAGTVFGAPTKSGRFAGVEIYRDPSAVSRYRAVAFPVAYPLLLALVIPCATLYAALRHRRRAVAGACAKCGYDLRGTPDRCPECGTAAR
jgi:hypothetical protein